METVLTFLILIVVTTLSAQRAGIPFEKRQTLEATLHSSRSAVVTNKPYSPISSKTKISDSAE